MAKANVGTILGYSKILATTPYIGSVFSILCNPAEQIYDERVEKLMIRSVVAGAAGNYTGKYNSEAGGTDTVEFIEVTLKNDRAKTIDIPYEKEIASYTAGMEPSINALTRDYLNRQLGSEMDAVTASTLYSKIDASNQLTDADLPVDNEHVFDTLDAIRAKAFTAGIPYTQNIFVFIAGNVFAGIQKYVRMNSGLANNAVLTTITRTIGLGDKLNEDGKGLELKTDVIVYNNMILLPVPDDRMFTGVDLLDGTSEGQTDGGYKKSDDASDLLLIAIPEGTAFMGIRFHVSNYFVPMIGAPNSEFSVGLDNGMKTVLGNIVVENGGVNQIGMNYTAHFRTIYDSDIKPLQKKTIFAIKKSA